MFVKSHGENETQDAVLRQAAWKKEMQRGDSHRYRIQVIF